MGLLLKIIEHGLGGSFEECSSTPRLTNSKPDDALYVKHHSIQTRWFVYGDRRRRVPESNLDLIQDEHERIRLGQLGLATLFGCGTDYIMPRGPGILFYEVHGSTDQVSQNYQDAIYLALRGSVLITIRGEAIRLDEGESIGCSGREVVSFALPEDSRAKGPSLVQFIGANRIGKVIGRNRMSQGIV